MITRIFGAGNSWRGTFIRFWLRPDWEKMHKTQNWWVKTDSGVTLGEVKWYAQWRKYAFFPEGLTVFEEVCLGEIAEFCKIRTQEHKAKGKTT